MLRHSGSGEHLATFCLIFAMLHFPILNLSTEKLMFLGITRISLEAGQMKLSILLNVKEPHTFHLHGVVVGIFEAALLTNHPTDRLF